MLEQYFILPSYLIQTLWDSTLETLYMVGVSSIVTLFFGLIVGVILNVTKSGGILPCFWLNQILGWFVNITRSFPFIILIILLLPLRQKILQSQNLLSKNSFQLQQPCSNMSFLFWSSYLYKLFSSLFRFPRSLLTSW